MGELDSLKGAIESRIAVETGGPVTVRALQPLSGGACQDNYRIELELAAGPLAGQRTMVLRSDARSSLPGSLGRKVEFAVIRAAVASGVKTPQAHWLLADLVRPGAYAYFMDF